MTKLLEHIKFVCGINQTLMHECSEGARTTKSLSEEDLVWQSELEYNKKHATSSF